MDLRGIRNKTDARSDYIDQTKNHGIYATVLDLLE
jgi:hypothetical protein